MIYGSAVYQLLKWIFQPPPPWPFHAVDSQQKSTCRAAPVRFMWQLWVIYRKREREREKEGGRGSRHLFVVDTLEYRQNLINLSLTLCEVERWTRWLWPRTGYALGEWSTPETEVIIALAAGQIDCVKKQKRFEAAYGNCNWSFLKFEDFVRQLTMYKLLVYIYYIYIYMMMYCRKTMHVFMQKLSYFMPNQS